MQTATSPGRLILVSNRLPITCAKTPDGKWMFKKSSGGLVTAISGLKDDFIWVGWTGLEIEEQDRPKFSEELYKAHSAIPVYLSDKLADDYYNGFANGTLWPLFHYVEFVYNSDLYKAYEEANKLFAQTLIEIIKPGDLVWIHDYHLMLLPQMLRQKLPNVTLGFFLHIPFPSSELYKVLPVRKPLLEGVLACDLIGFQTWDYARHFEKACTRILGTETKPNSAILFNNTEIPVSIFPVGIPVTQFLTELRGDPVKQRLQELKTTFKGKKIFIGVDRLDYIKGIPHKLRGFALFLKQNPSWVGKVVLIQIAIPSRTDVDDYINQKREVDQLVGQINSEFGSLSYQPINYLYKSVNFTELVALYALSDVALITSLRDGLNLVAQEYVACQDGKESKGVLIISEFAGAAQCLAGALKVNPHNCKEVADTILRSLTADEQTKETKHLESWKFITEHTAEFWGASFISELKKIHQNHIDTLQKVAGERVDLNQIIHKFNSTQKNRLIILEYDGTLVPYNMIPSLATPNKIVLDLLNKLCSNPKNKVFILSGRTKEVMYKWFGGINHLNLCAEHGFFYFDPEKKNWISISNDFDFSWMESIEPVFEYFRERTPGSLVEKKETNLTWHWRGADPEYGSSQSRDLQLHLDNFFGKWIIDVEIGNKTIEVKPGGVNVTNFVNRMMKGDIDVDKILYVGTGTLDTTKLIFNEDQSEVFTCIVNKPSFLKTHMHLEGTDEVIKFLYRFGEGDALDVGEELKTTSTTVSSWAVRSFNALDRHKIDNIDKN